MIDKDRFITAVFRSSDTMDLRHYIKGVDTKTGIDFHFYVSSFGSFATYLKPCNFPENRIAINKKTLDAATIKTITGYLSTLEMRLQ